MAPVHISNQHKQIKIFLHQLFQKCKYWQHIATSTELKWVCYMFFVKIETPYCPLNRTHGHFTDLLNLRRSVKFQRKKGEKVSGSGWLSGTAIGPANGRLWSGRLIFLALFSWKNTVTLNDSPAGIRPLVTGRKTLHVVSTRSCRERKRIGPPQREPTEPRRRVNVVPAITFTLLILPLSLSPSPYTVFANVKYSADVGCRGSSTLHKGELLQGKKYTQKKLVTRASRIVSHFVSKENRAGLAWYHF